MEKQPDPSGLLRAHLLDERSLHFTTVHPCQQDLPTARRPLVPTSQPQQGLKIRDTKRVVLKFQEKSPVEEIAQGSLIPVCARNFFPRIRLPRRIRQCSRLSHKIPRRSEVVR